MVVRLAPVQKELARRHLHLPRVIAVQVWRAVARKLDLDDLEGHGTDGLIHAAAEYDPGRGTSFATFARYRIRGAMVDAIRREARFARLRADLEAAVVVRVPEVSADQLAERRQIFARLQRALDALPFRQQHLVRLVYFEGKPLGLAGAELDISPSRTTRFHAQMVRRLSAELVGSGGVR